MSLRTVSSGVIFISAVLGSGTPVRAADAVSASVSAVTRGADGKRLGQVQVTAHSARTNSDQIVVSAADGAYAVGGLVPGEYQLTAKATGLSSSQPMSVVVTNRQNSYAGIFLGKIASPSAPAPTNVSAVAKPGFWKRFGQAYWDDWHPSASSDAPTAAYRGYPAPVTNPPYPFTLWPMGGTPNIGYPGATQYPLTTALQTGPHGDWWKKTNVQIYGWADIGMNVSSSNKGPYPNAPAAYDQLADSFILDQLTLYIERVPDTVKRITLTGLSSHQPI